MKVFNEEKEWESKVNFVDENNAVLGYDLSQQCCEYAGWFIADAPEARCIYDVSDEEKSKWWSDSQKVDLAGWTFDPNYFNEPVSEDQFNDWMVAIFRIVNGDKEKFLHIFNCHNGYYAHGFTFTVAGQDVRQETL